MKWRTSTCISAESTAGVKDPEPDPATGDPNFGIYAIEEVVSPTETAARPVGGRGFAEFLFDRAAGLRQFQGRQL